MIRYKVDVLAELGKAGYTKYRIRRDGLLPSSAVKALANGEPISFSTIDSLCELLRCDVGDILFFEHTQPVKREVEHVADDSELSALASKYGGGVNGL